MTEFRFSSKGMGPCALMLLLVLVGTGCEPTLFAAPINDVSVEKSDVLFFFDSISCEHGKVHFDLSRKAMGMSWRMINAKDDVTGVCNYKQTLVVPVSSSLEIKSGETAILFRPAELPVQYGDQHGEVTYRVWKRGGEIGRAYGEDFCASCFTISDSGSWDVSHH